MTQAEQEQLADIEVENARVELIRLAEAGAFEVQAPATWVGALFLVGCIVALGGVAMMLGVTG